MTGEEPLLTTTSPLLLSPVILSIETSPLRPFEGAEPLRKRTLPPVEIPAPPKISKCPPSKPDPDDTLTSPPLLAAAEPTATEMSPLLP